jgi:Tol biopolymer transport system component
MTRMWILAGMMSLGICLLWLKASGQTKTERLPRLPGATLLLGYPPQTLLTTAGDATSTLQNEGGDWWVTPSISAHGNVIASASRDSSVPRASRERLGLIVSIYSVAAQSWTKYKDLEILGGTVSISPDGATLACVTREPHGAVYELRFLDILSGKIMTGPELANNAGSITWSPDGRRIAFDREVKRSSNQLSISPLRAIYILDIEAGSVTKIADGMAPSWSPSGEWIVFNDYSPGRDDIRHGRYATNTNRISAIHPDGTNFKVLATFSKDEDLRLAPVWSPDSKMLLINKFRDEDKATMDIYMLDPVTLKLAKRFTDTPPVYAWVSSGGR